MICVECTNPVDELYFKYKSEYIQLTICSNCSNPVDRYIEYDNVVLFIDILLLKPQAYRHLVYNVLAADLNQTEAQIPQTIRTSNAWYHVIQTYVLKYRKLSRYFILMVLFEVYLTWAYEEKNSTHSPVVNFIINQPIYTQYSFYMLKIILELIVYHISIQNLFANTRNIPDFSVVLLTTVLISSAIRLFPILMLIWPYDTTTSTTVINAIAIINTTEALHMVIQESYFYIIVVLLVSLGCKIALSHLIISVIFSYFTSIPLWELVTYL